MNKIILVFLGLLLLTTKAFQTHGDNEPCQGQANNKPIQNFSFKNLTREINHGQLFTNEYDGRLFYALNLTGTPYQMGYAYGALMKEEIDINFATFWPWARNFAINSLHNDNGVPMWILKRIEPYAYDIFDFLLDLNYQITEQYTPARWNEEMEGMAASSGKTVEEIRRVNLIPELLKAACSTFGAWEKATSSGQLIQLRSLDWDETAPISTWPTLVTYHSVEQGSVSAFSNIGWPGVIGTLTGYNSEKIGVGERLGGSGADTQTRYGTPWMYVLRDMLQFSSSQQQAIQYLKDANRTCAVYLGIGDGKSSGIYNILRYTYEYVKVYDWQTWDHDQNHPMLEDCMWKEFRTHETCFKDLITPQYGKMDPEFVFRQLAPKGRTGDSQVVTFDYENDILYIQYPDPVTHTPGYKMTPLAVDMGYLFGKK